MDEGTLSASPAKRRRRWWVWPLRIFLGLLTAIVLLVAVVAWRNWDMVQRIFLGGVKIYETVPPPVPADLPRPAILIFSKTNGFRHVEAIPAGNAFLRDEARARGWGYFQTENGAAFNPAILARFDAVVFNNSSGDTLTGAQKEAFKAFVERGGGYVGIHAAGDNSHSWPWFVANLIGAGFTGHPMSPQFQQATVRVEDRNHVATAALPVSWVRTDEWYSFDRSPRSAGFRILATLDERSYQPKGMFGSDLAMGADHPVIWWRCVGRGRMIYSALGHSASAFAEPLHRAMLGGAVQFAIGAERAACDGK